MTHSRFSPDEDRRRQERMWGPPGYVGTYVPAVARTPRPVHNHDLNGIYRDQDT